MALILYYDLPTLSPSINLQFMIEGFGINADKNRSIVALLVDMARSDLFSAPIEFQYIFGIAEQLGVSRLEVEDVRDNPKNFPFDPPPTEQERMTILYYLLFTMRVDGEIKPSEENYLHDISLKLGMNPLLTEDLIRVMKSYANESVPPSAMLEQVKKYLN